MDGYMSEIPGGIRRRISTITDNTITELEDYAFMNSEKECDMFSLPYFQASLFATVLEDSIIEMRILVGCNNELRMIKARQDMGLLRALKYSVEQPTHKDELDGVVRTDLKRDEYKVNKLDADRTTLQNQLTSFYLNLCLQRSFGNLVSEVNCTQKRINHYNVLLEEEAKNRITRRDLSKQVRHRRNHIKSVYYDTNCIIEELRTQVEDAALNAEACSRYVEGWQRARTEQNDQSIKFREALPLEKIEFYKQKCDQEQRVHAEVEMHTNIAIEETVQKIEDWMNKFDKDMEAIDLKIQIIKNKHIAALEQRQTLEETIEKHQELMNLWVNYKDAREKARLYREKMNNAATVVQAWWRGLLVRNQLGPYKPQPKKKAAGQGKKK